MTTVDWMSGGSARVRAVAAGACALALSCGHAEGPRGRRPAAESELRIWVSPVVRWQPGAIRELRFLIENASNRTIALAEPDPDRARVVLYAGPEDDRACGTASPSSGASEAPETTLAPGDLIAMRVDLDAACRSLPAGEYRFVVSYRAPPPAPGAKLWAGALPAQYGTVIVEQAGAARRKPLRRPQRPGARARGALEGRGIHQGARTRPEPSRADAP